MKLRASLGFLGGTVLLLSSIAHAFLGWPTLEALLKVAEVQPELTGALAVGWYFGSVAMLAFGLIVGHSAWRMWQGAAVSTVPAGIIAALYLLFGLGAYLSRDFNPHFLLFVLTGVLVGIFAFWRRPEK